MSNEIWEAIRQDIRARVKENSEQIFKIKQDALDTSKEIPHIHPKHEKWNEYVGRKRQVTLLIIALHLHKYATNFDRIESHTNKSNHDQMTKLANEMLCDITDKYTKKEVANV
jgi:hypothetical protein